MCFYPTSGSDEDLWFIRSLADCGTVAELESSCSCYLECNQCVCVWSYRLLLLEHNLSLVSFL